MLATSKIKLIPVHKDDLRSLGSSTMCKSSAGPSSQARLTFRASSPHPLFCPASIENWYV